MMSELLEICMVVCFGLSWPMSVLKSYRARTAKGKSLFFLVMICIGYVYAIAAAPSPSAPTPSNFLNLSQISIISRFC